MQHKSLLNFIAILLIVSFSIIPLNVTCALSPQCDKLTVYSNTDEESCAIAAAIDQISNGKKFIRFNDLGRNSKYDLLFFDASEINGVLSNITYTKNVNEFIAQNENRLMKNNKAISTGIYTLGIGSSLWHIFNGEGLLNYGNLFFMALTTGLSALISNLACAANSYFSHKNLNKILKTSIVEKNNYFDTLKILLKHLKHNELTPGNILCLRLKSNPAIVRILNKKSSGIISIDEQNKFNNDVKKLKKEITSMLSNEDELW